MVIAHALTTWRQTVVDADFVALIAERVARHRYVMKPILVTNKPVDGLSNINRNTYLNSKVRAILDCHA